MCLITKFKKAPCPKGYGWKLFKVTNHAHNGTQDLYSYFGMKMTPYKGKEWETALRHTVAIHKINYRVEYYMSGFHIYSSPNSLAKEIDEIYGLMEYVKRYTRIGLVQYDNAQTEGYDVNLSNRNNARVVVAGRMRIIDSFLVSEWAEAKKELKILKRMSRS